jgi:hypothetical protein
MALNLILGGSPKWRTNRGVPLLETEGQGPGLDVSRRSVSSESSFKQNNELLSGIKRASLLRLFTNYINEDKVKAFFTKSLSFFG